jgi:hypothetical protein
MYNAYYFNGTNEIELKMPVILLLGNWLSFLLVSQFWARVLGES